MKLYALASFFATKWGQNYLPSPQDEKLEEPPSTPPAKPPQFEERRPGVSEERRPGAFEEGKPVEWTEGVGPQPAGMKATPAKSKSPYDEIKGPADRSLGVAIAPDRAQKWKDNLVRVYDHVVEELTQLPFFKAIYEDMPNEKVLRQFNHLINAYVPNIAKANLHDAFVYGVKYVDAFNDLRNQLPSMVKDREKMHRLDYAIWSTQMRIWDKVKDVLNIHDMKWRTLPTTPEEQAELIALVKAIPRGTWKYGPMSNPTKPLFRKNRQTQHGIEDPELRELMGKQFGPGKRAKPKPGA